MSGPKLAPWVITVAAVALAVLSWSRPMAAPQVLPGTVLAPAPTRVEDAALAQIVERAVRDALAGHEPPSAPDPDRSAEAAAEREGLDVVADVVARGAPTPDDQAALRSALSRTDRAGGEAILSAWGTALNRGDIRIPRGQPPL